LYELPIQDVAFAIVYSMYILVADAVRSDRNRPAKVTGRVYDRRQLTKSAPESSQAAFFQKYIECFAMAGVVLPMILVLISDCRSETARISIEKIFLDLYDA